MPRSATSAIRSMLPADFAIFWPPTWRNSPWPPTRAGGPPTIGADWAISSSWWGNTLSIPPVWTSNRGPRCFSAIAEHSRCQPGKPSPQRGVGHFSWRPSPAAPGRLPQREVGRVALVGLDLAAMAGPERVERVAGEAAVVGERRDVVVDVAIGADVGMAGVDELLGELD